MIGVTQWGQEDPKAFNRLFLKFYILVVFAGIFVAATAGLSLLGYLFAAYKCVKYAKERGFTPGRLLRAVWISVLKFGGAIFGLTSLLIIFLIIEARPDFSADNHYGLTGWDWLAGLGILLIGFLGIGLLAQLLLYAIIVSVWGGFATRQKPSSPYMSYPPTYNRLAESNFFSQPAPPESNGQVANTQPFVRKTLE